MNNERAECNLPVQTESVSTGKESLEITTTKNIKSADPQIKSSDQLTANKPRINSKKIVGAELLKEDSTQKLFGEASIKHHVKKESSKFSKKEKLIPKFVMFSDVVTTLNKIDNSSSKSLEKYVDLLFELKNVEKITTEQIREFMYAAKSQLNTLWMPFLTKVAMNLDPNKLGFNDVLCMFVQEECIKIFDSHGISPDKFSELCIDFQHSKDGSVITQFIKKTLPKSKDTSTQKTADRITKQELVCVIFICLSLQYQNQGRNSYKTQVIIDRAIAEAFSEWSSKEIAGKTLGNILSAKIFSTKKISELTYLYEGTSEKIVEQESRIKELERIHAELASERSALRTEIEHWNSSHEELLHQIDHLKSENESLEQQKTTAENMLDYEKNKFERQLDLKEAGIAEQFSDDIGLELQAIRELTEYLEEGDQRRIRRRLNRIDSILQESGGK